MDDQDTKNLEELNRELREARKLVGMPEPGPRAPDKPPLCSFCGAGANNVRKIFSGNRHGTDSAVFICSDCVETCQLQIDNG